MSPNGQCRARQHLRTISVRNPKELLRQLATLEALLGNVPDPIVFVGADGLVREANAAARELLPALGSANRFHLECVLPRFWMPSREPRQASPISSITTSAYPRSAPSTCGSL